MRGDVWDIIPHPPAQGKKQDNRSTDQNLARLLQTHILTYSFTPKPVIMTETQEQHWKWCTKCACLYFAGNSVCRANNGVHDLSGSAMYTVSYDASAPGQESWKWCKKCQVLSYTGKTVGPCQAGGQHDVTGSGNYRLASSGGGESVALVQQMRGPKLAGRTLHGGRQPRVHRQRRLPHLQEWRPAGAGGHWAG
jgi:hypothetical protein